MQNIGAYGVEIKSVFEKLEALEIDSLQQKVFSKEACEFGYRHSIFKGKLKGDISLQKCFLNSTKSTILKPHMELYRKSYNRWALRNFLYKILVRL